MAQMEILWDPGMWKCSLPYTHILVHYYKYNSTRLVTSAITGQTGLCFLTVTAVPESVLAG